jgi:cation diffusion facilitator family transporter
MGGHQHSHALSERSAETQRVTVIGALVNLLLAAVKLVVGFMAQSAALVADGIHSVSDLLSDVLVWFAARHAGEAPDAEHPYGHGRFETAATLALGILLGFVALGIVWEAVERTASGETAVPGTLAIYAALFSIAANEGLYWYTVLVARRINSPMLKANAWHHRSDAVSSIVVLVGVAGAMLGWPYLDAVAAIIVGAMIAKIGWDLGWEAMCELVDTALDEEDVQRAREVIMAVDGVRSVHMLRTRKQGHEAAADVHVQVAPHLSVSEGHMISQAVEDRLKETVEAITDVTVHVDPEDDEQAPPCSGLPLREEAVAQLRTLWPQVPEPYDIVLHYLSGKIHIELHLPLSHFSSEERMAAFRESLQSSVKDDDTFGDVDILYR